MRTATYTCRCSPPHPPHHACSRELTQKVCTDKSKKLCVTPLGNVCVNLANNKDHVSDK